MKALHVINSLVAGGAERSLADLLPRLSEGGLECRILALDSRGDVFSEGLRRAGVEVFFSRPGGASPYSPARLPALRKAIRDFGPDLVHAHLGPAQHWAWAVLESLSEEERRPLVITEHAVWNRRMALPLLRPLERRIYGGAASIVAVSEGVAASLVTWLGLESSAIEVIPNGIDPARFEGAAPDAELRAWAGDRPLLLMVGRLVEAKDHVTALRMLGRLPSRFALALVGEGPERARIEALATELGLWDRLRLLGTRTDVPSLLAAADFYLQTSSHEGFGIAAVEAMAAGLPLCVSEAGGLPSVVGAGGLHFPVGDDAAGAAALLRLEAEPGLAEGLARAGRERARLFSADETARRHIELYEGILARESRALGRPRA